MRLVACYDVLQASELLDICHPRPVGLTIANSLGARLSIMYRSIHKCHALPTRDSGYYAGLSVYSGRYGEAKCLTKLYQPVYVN